MKRKYPKVTIGAYKTWKKKDLRELVYHAYGDPRIQQDKGKIRELQFMLECHRLKGCDM